MGGPELAGIEPNNNIIREIRKLSHIRPLAPHYPG